MDVTESNLKQRAILDAAIAQFAEYGMAGVRMEAVAEQASVSKRTLYKYFPSKERLFDALFECLMARISPIRNRIYLPHRDFIEQLLEIGVEEMQLLSDPEFHKLARVVALECMRSKVQAEKIFQRFASKENCLYQWFQQAAEQGVLGDLQPELACELFLAPLKTMGFWGQLMNWKSPLDETQQRAVLHESVRMLVSRTQKPTAEVC